MASDMRIYVVVRLNLGSGGEDVIGSEVWGSYGFGSERIGIDGVSSDGFYC